MRFSACVGQAEQDQRRAVGVAVVVPLHGHDLDRLVLQRVEAVQVAGNTCTGATIAAIHMAMENMRARRACPRGRAAGARPPTPPTMKAVVR
jgi:hypothetical protein